MAERLILITNDDGVYAEGIRTLAPALAVHGRVVMVAPDRQQSASSHALSLHRPLRVRQLADDIHAVEGTPADCVVMAVRKLLGRHPDLVVSGINDGPNMGDDVNYSGTVAAAVEGSLLGIPSLAVSLGWEEERDFTAAARIAAELAEQVLKRQTPHPPELDMPATPTESQAPAERRRPHRLVLNVNVPGCPAAEIGPMRLTRLGKRIYRDAVVEKTDPRGDSYYWIGGDAPIWLPEHEDGTMTDFSAVKRREVSVTPLSLDMTDYTALNQLAGWGLDS